MQSGAYSLPEEFWMDPWFRRTVTEYIVNEAGEFIINGAIPGSPAPILHESNHTLRGMAKLKHYFLGFATFVRRLVGRNNFEQIRTAEEPVSRIYGDPHLLTASNSSAERALKIDGHTVLDKLGASVIAHDRPGDVRGGIQCNASNVFQHVLELPGVQACFVTEGGDASKIGWSGLPGVGRTPTGKPIFAMVGFWLFVCLVVWLFGCLVV